MSRPLVVLGLLLAGCAQTPRAVAPLRYDDRYAEPAPDDPALAEPPLVTADPLPSLHVEEATLANGFRVLVVARKGHPVLVSRLVFPHGSPDVGDAGGVRAGLVAPVLFAPAESRLEATEQCAWDGCWIGAQGDRDELPALLDDLVTLAARPSEAQATLARRFTAATAMSGKFSPELAMNRNVMRALFEGTAYAVAGPPATGTLPELLAVRDRLFNPAGATLVVVGDTSLERVRALAEARFGSWASPAGRSARAEIAPLRPGPIVAVQNPSISQVHALIAARVPKPRTRDDFALGLALSLVTATHDSPAYAHIREEMGASYGVNASRLLGARDVGAVAIGGSFDQHKAAPALAALLEEIRALRAAPPDARALAHAKAQAIARWRELMATNAGVATTLTSQVLFAGSPTELDLPAQIAAVTPDDVQRVARTLLADDQLRLVVVGETRWMKGDLEKLGLGRCVVRDGFAKD